MDAQDTRPQFEVGRSYYLRTGQKVELVAVTTDGEFLVSQILEIETYDGTGYGQGAPAFVSEIFEAAPREVVDEELLRLTEESAKLASRNIGLRSDILNAEKDNRERFKKLEKYRGLERLEDFIDGKITHVVIEDYDGFKVGPLSLLEEKTDANYRKPEGIRLISLYGKTDGKLEWRVNEYRDGSGSSWRQIVPASSLEDAEQLRRDIVLAKLSEQWAGYVEDRPHYFLLYARMALEYGVPVAADIMAAYEKAREAGNQKTAETLRKEIAERQAKLDALAKVSP